MELQLCLGKLIQQRTENASLVPGTDIFPGKVKVLIESQYRNLEHQALMGENVEQSKSRMKELKLLLGFLLQ